jgi:NitT/TauT family transport system ATP-binding protein
MTTSPYMIELREVSHAYRTKAGDLPVLDNLSLAIPENTFCAVVGPSGCGKSTLTRLVSGLMKPSEGQVWLHSQLVTSPRPTVGMAFQNPVLLEWRTILENVLLPMEIVKSTMSRAEAEKRARHLLELVGLSGFEDKRPSELSGGMRQRASLCRSIIHKPDVLILDEPFGALDAFTREDLWCTMHDLRESVFLADQVVVLSGRPAHAQYVLDVDIPAKRKLDDLYTPRAVEMLATLRHQIQVAQGRAADADAPLAQHAPPAKPVRRPIPGAMQ